MLPFEEEFDDDLRAALLRVAKRNSVRASASKVSTTSTTSNYEENQKTIQRLKLLQLYKYMYKLVY